MSLLAGEREVRRGFLFGGGGALETKVLRLEDPVEVVVEGVADTAFTTVRNTQGESDELLNAFSREALLQPLLDQMAFERTEENFFSFHPSHQGLIRIIPTVHIP